MDGTAELIGFAYGEDIEQGSGRSLGYRLLAPASGPAWAAEAEALARRLQAAPYPDAWPPVDLFCSVLLADGRRLIARARYGLTDHTGERRGGLELVGVVAPAGVEVRAALAIYRWLGERREGEEDLHRLDGSHRLAEVLSAAPPEPAHAETISGPVPVLPVRLWQDGTFLFAAAAPAEPDHHLRLLEAAATPHWQWLPLVGPDFPLPTYAQRGPLLAWTAHLAGVAVRLDRPAPPPPPAPRNRWLPAALAGLMIALLGGNLWALLALRQEIAAVPREVVKDDPPAKKIAPTPTRETEDARERFARALYRLMADQSGERAGKDERAALLDRYEALVRRYPELAVSADNEDGKLAVAAASVLAGRSPARIDQAVKQALEGKGFSDKLIQAARDHVREQFAAEGRR